MVKVSVIFSLSISIALLSLVLSQEVPAVALQRESEASCSLPDCRELSTGAVLKNDVSMLGTRAHVLKKKGHKTYQEAGGNLEEACSETLSGSKDEGYRGCQSMTRSGKDCQKWTSQSPHAHATWNTPSATPGKGLDDHNYCRNPDGEPTIWCYTTDTQSRWEFCDPAQACSETLSGSKDEGYRGCQSMTRSGKDCQKWTSQSPHAHATWNTPSATPFKGLDDHSYCRNPDGEPTIWCYTTDPQSRWEFCDPAQTSGSYQSCVALIKDICETTGETPSGVDIAVHSCHDVWNHAEFHGWVNTVSDAEFQAANQKVGNLYTNRGHLFFACTFFRDVSDCPIPDLYNTCNSVFTLSAIDSQNVLNKWDQVMEWRAGMVGDTLQQGNQIVLHQTVATDRVLLSRRNNECLSGCGTLKCSSAKTIGQCTSTLYEANAHCKWENGNCVDQAAALMQEERGASSSASLASTDETLARKSCES